MSWPLERIREQESKVAVLFMKKFKPIFSFKRTSETMMVLCLLKASRAGALNIPGNIRYNLLGFYWCPVCKFLDLTGVNVYYLGTCMPTRLFTLYFQLYERFRGYDPCTSSVVMYTLCWNFKIRKPTIYGITERRNVANP